MDTRQCPVPPRRMLDGIAQAIAQEATEIFRQLDEVQGGTAEIKRLRKAG